MKSKNVSDIEKLINGFYYDIENLENKIDDINDKIHLLEASHKTSIWIDDILKLANDLKGDENIDTVISFIQKSANIDSHVTGFILFDKSWLDSIREALESTTNAIVPKTFNEWSYHHNRMIGIMDMVETYDFISLKDIHRTKITKIIKLIETINAWCLHRWYVLDENPTLAR